MDLNQQLVAAARAGKIDEVRHLLELGADPSTQGNEAIRHALIYGHRATANVLLADPRVDLMVNMAQIFLATITAKDMEGIQLILQNPKVDPAAEDNRLLRIAIQHGAIEVVKLLLQNPRIDLPATKNKALEIAASYGRLFIAQFLIERGADPTVNEYEAVRMAVQSREQTVGQYLLSLPGILVPVLDYYLNNDRHDLNEVIRYGMGPAYTGNVNDIFIWAAEIGSIELVNLELRNAVDPGYNNNTAIRAAAKNGHLDIVQLLAPNPKVDVTVDNNAPFRFAVEQGYSDIVLYLFRFPGVVLPTIDHYIATGQYIQLQRLAAMTGSLSDDDSDLMVWGAVVGSLNLIRALIEKGVSPDFADNSAIHAAQQHGHADIVNYLFDLPGVYF